MRPRLAHFLFDTGAGLCARGYRKKSWEWLLNLSHWVQGEGKGPWARLG
jgi:hypothetical protein